MNWRTTLFVGGLALAVLPSCTSDDGSEGGSGPTTTAAASSTTATTVPDRPATYRDAECPMDVPAEVTVEVECGYLTVPENRLDPESRTIDLAVARLRSGAAEPAPDPVVQLEGGPGFASLENVVGYAKSSILDTRDLVLFDQRGLGYSTPNLNCTETDAAVYAGFETTDPADVEAQRIADSYVACRQRLVAEGVDLSGYDTVESAADVADLRVALEIDEWNLRGVSYGSILAQEVLRSHPEGIRAALIDSTIPPDEPGGGVDRAAAGLRAFDELAAACADSATCAEAYGDVNELFAQAAAALDAEPHRTTVVDPTNDEPHDVAITGDDLYAGLFRAMYDRTLLPLLPSAAKAIRDGDRSIIDTLAASSIPFAAAQTEGMTISVTCADRGRLLDPDAVEPFLEEHPEMSPLVFLLAPETACGPWDVEANPPSSNELLTETDVPVLLLAGRFDPVTPPEGTARVAEALGVPLLTNPVVGHGFISDECGNGIFLAWLDDPTTEPDASCLDEAEPLFG